MPHINEMIPSKWLKFSDLKGRTHEVVIDKIVTEEVGQQREQKWIMYFVGKQKGMVLNPTKIKVMNSLHGPHTDGWIGKAISISPGKTPFKGDIVDCINVAASLNAKTAPAAVAAPAHPAHDDADVDEDMDDEIPF